MNDGQRSESVEPTGESGPLLSEHNRLRNRIVEALEPYDIPTGAWSNAEKVEPAEKVIEALGDWLDDIQKRVEESESYKQGRADGYREACELFAAELEAGREARRQLATLSGGSGPHIGSSNAEQSDR